MKEVETEKKTPYQGKSRACGYFECGKCRKRWFSKDTWANRSQKCTACHIDVYPYRQLKPEKPSEPRKETGPHSQKKCQKCRHLGFYCGSKHASSKS
ncbi:zinc finger CCHC domain-containing protein 24 [Penaeus vannamei]|uniref:zinc finger CCHC domain-containing protein 24 n=1 Tax=Penaeus vannamei TaxID=6689 RepID=UPI00387F3D7A